mmetsp:Transcript_30875/g.40993  ORF Transcript_30875/g.40993 Transcript_30875/m.40993 type:complete len:80 (+) Transcript_30875:149-388(+)|eukprot:CAMPEP_0185597752 /NCGR_PEP_ID=MMETSP0434-20130131/81566_1 /TAXON_ID=626734 ORGANISM="Favella taraikaensis, Strain Fe Narragansett Bay" /NCGR_SAMPLE_ID=MMETSP0434 /ASSEMBLY_ACC=CAM_ASM_000379 /LENGTH=79 /DNA_ID=CAMNT_0028226561 /DNA_START=99 /DNA_END=338 /DNA_ORIENTATION=-
MASSFASGFTTATESSNGTIMRNRAFNNQESMHGSSQKPGRLPMYYLNTSSGVQASDPNSMRDMGGVRNVIYQLDDPVT